MGQCIKCGRETANSYVYYSADYHSQGDSSQAGGMVYRTVRYNNIERHCEFICPKCTSAGGIEFYIVAGICYLFTAFLVVFPFVAPREKGSAPVWVIVGSFVVASLFLVLGLILTRIHNRDIKADKRLKEDAGSYLLVNIIKYRNPKKNYFTTEQYRNLSKY